MFHHVFCINRKETRDTLKRVILVSLYIIYFKFEFHIAYHAA